MIQIQTSNDKMSIIQVSVSSAFKEVVELQTTILMGDFIKNFWHCKLYDCLGEFDLGEINERDFNFAKSRLNDF